MSGLESDQQASRRCCCRRRRRCLHAVRRRSPVTHGLSRSSRPRRYRHAFSGPASPRPICLAPTKSKAALDPETPGRLAGQGRQCTGACPPPRRRRHDYEEDAFEAGARPKAAPCGPHALPIELFACRSSSLSDPKLCGGATNTPAAWARSPRDTLELSAISQGAGQQSDGDGREPEPQGRIEQASRPQRRDREPGARASSAIRCAPKRLRFHGSGRSIRRRPQVERRSSPWSGSPSSPAPAGWRRDDIEQNGPEQGDGASELPPPYRVRKHPCRAHELGAEQAEERQDEDTGGRTVDENVLTAQERLGDLAPMNSSQAGEVR